MVFFNNNEITFIPNEFSKREGRLAAMTLLNNPLSDPEKQKANNYFKHFWLLKL